MTILEFQNATPNPSLEINDLAYFVSSVTPMWGDQYYTADTVQGVSNYIFIGNVSSIILNTSDDDIPGYTVTIEEPSNVVLSGDNIPSTGDYFFFAKNNIAEVSSLKGYYSEVTFKNNSKKKAELFSVGCVVAESSK